MRPVRVGILIASLQQGGAERAALGLLDRLHAAGVDVFLLTLDRNREMALTADPEASRILSRRIIRLSGSDVRWSTVSKTLFGPWHWIRLGRALRRLDIDVLVSIMERANILNLVTPGARRRILSIRSYPSLLLSSKTPLKRFLVVRFYNILLRRADRMVFVSREAAADFEALFPIVSGRGTVIYNMCDIDRVRALGQSPIPEKFASFFEKPALVSVGRLNPEKGHWHLLRAFERVSRRETDARLVILGKGPLERELLRLRDGLGLTDRVLFPGFQTNPLAWVAKAQAFVLPSLWEGFPNSLLEAMALGIPVVSSDCRSGPRELLAPNGDPTHKTESIDFTPFGTLVAPPDGQPRAAGQALTRQEELLAEAMERVLRDPRLRSAQARAARERADAFAPERIVSQWIQLLREGR